MPQDTIWTVLSTATTCRSPTASRASGCAVAGWSSVAASVTASPSPGRWRPGDSLTGPAEGDQLWLGRRRRSAATAVQGHHAVRVVERARAVAHPGLGQDQLDSLGGFEVTIERRNHRAHLLVASHGQEGRGAAIGLHADEEET